MKLIWSIQEYYQSNIQYAKDTTCYAHCKVDKMKEAKHVCGVTNLTGERLFETLFTVTWYTITDLTYDYWPDIQLLTWDTITDLTRLQDRTNKVNLTSIFKTNYRKGLDTISDWSAERNLISIQRKPSGLFFRHCKWIVDMGLKKPI